MLLLIVIESQPPTLRPVADRSGARRIAVKRHEAEIASQPQSSMARGSVVRRMRDYFPAPPTSTNTAYKSSCTVRRAMPSRYPTCSWVK